MRISEIKAAFGKLSRAKRILIGAAVVLCAGGAAWLYHEGCRSVIVVDGRPVVCVCSRREAEQVLQQVKSVSGADPAEVEFKQKVVVARAPRGASPVSRHRALGILRTAVSPVFCRMAIIVDGEPAVAVPSEEMAADVLDLAKLKFGSLAKNLAEEPQFKQDVKVDIAVVSPEIYCSTAESALDMLLTRRVRGSGRAVYTVRQGDNAWTIATRRGLSVDGLAKLNPGINLEKLQIGDRLIVAGSATAGPGLTVIVRDLVTREEPVPPPVHRVTSAQLYAGKTYLVSPGRWGRRAVRRVDIYENGRKVGSEVADEQILREASPKIVAFGIKPRR